MIQSNTPRLGKLDISLSKQQSLYMTIQKLNCLRRAGAIWRTHAPPGEVEQCEWDIESYMTWMKHIDYEPEKAKEMGLKACNTVVSCHFVHTDVDPCTEMPHYHLFVSLTSSLLSKLPLSIAVNVLI